MDLNPPIKIIFFDVGNVLVTKTQSKDRIISQFLHVDHKDYDAVLQQILASPEAAEHWKAVRDRGEEKDWEYWLLGEITAHPKLKLKTKVDHKLLNRLVELYLSGNRGYELIEDVYETLLYLKTKYRLGIISNAPSQRRSSELTHYNLLQYFDPIILSGEIGVAKPNPEIFEYALSLAQVSGDEAVFIDNQVNYLAGAKAAGIKQCILFNFDAVKQDEFPEVRKLRELVGIF